MAGREGINRLLAAMEGEPQAAEVARMSSIIQRAPPVQARETVEDLQVNTGVRQPRLRSFWRVIASKDIPVEWPGTPGIANAGTGG
jgi:hypothetical protein